MSGSREEFGSKIYINPNYNRQGSSNVHVNPLFDPNKVKSDHHMQRIFVNPNFIKPQIPSKELKVPVYQKENFTETQSSDVTKSRYSLVRHNADKSIPIKPLEHQSIKPALIGINRYKSVSLTIAKKVQNQVPSTSKPKPKLSNTPTKANKYKFVRRSNSITGSSKHRVIKRKSIRLTPSKTNIIKAGTFKKNNIPCRLFRKYGVCLRQQKGTCEYLHDKKYVSVCRNFIKGECFNQNCVFSHELSSKKMPTCSFYLQGSCVKENCPYVHVKLNDTVEVCADFKNGYCEKGNQCLKRHPAEVLKKNKSVKTRNKVVKKQKRKSSVSVADECLDSKRYYKKSVDQGSECVDVNEIKPKRCKIGSLPSYIKL